MAAGKRLGKTDSNTPVDVSFILRAQHLTELEARVQSSWSGSYLTTRQFAARYGQPASTINAIEKYLHHYGITTKSYSDGLDISAKGTAAEFNQALGITLQNYRVRESAANGSGRVHTATVHGSLRNPRVASSWGSSILAILGLSNYAPFVSNALAAKGNQTLAKKDTSDDGVPPGLLTPSDFASRYGLNSLYNSHANGQGTTLGIVTLATFDPAVAVEFWNNYLGLHESTSRISVDSLDGGAPGPSLDAGTDETDLDVEQSGALAAKAKIRVYEAPNTDPGFADAFYAAASENIADTVSTSWGESETYIQAAVASGTETPAYAATFDQAFLEFGAQGQSNFTASGDAGAYQASADLGTTNLSVDNPADSPYTTAAGGTTLPGVQSYAETDASGNPTGATESANIPNERAWSWDYLWPLYKAFGAPSEVDFYPGAVAGDGGGYSTIEPRPTYQRGISGYNARQFLTPTTETEQAPGVDEPTEWNFNPTGPFTTGHTSQGRGLPDVSTDADPQTGYAVYDPALFDGGFVQYGGTSFVAPQLNGATAVIDSLLGRRVGFWNPQIYAFANGAHSPFTSLNDSRNYQGPTYLYETSANGSKVGLSGVFANDNLYYTGRAGTSWNPAVGLGTPNLAALANDFGRAQ